ncbi:M1 family metallopeptidase [Robertkochia sediminum]|uniref:M1 family metallopeptidase n=1 Tax=Robertkochia sediminum TaxID=2785326 RepID=UPI0019331FCB|nr:M1 family metallopeptidase [Robertkochia sediminum]MBL7473591.1 M1 family metallopeptidase [Robertkochia sediminum]
MKRFLYVLVFLSISVSWAQKPGNVDFTEGRIAIEVVPDSGLIKGTVAYDLRVLEATDSVVVSSRELDILGASLQGKALAFESRGNNLILYHSWEKGAYRDLEIQYKVQPRNAVYFPGWNLDESDVSDPEFKKEGGRQVWTQGQGKYSSSWVPSFDDMNEKVRFSLAILFPSGFEVLANGQLKGVEKKGSKTLWKYRMKYPVSSYLLAFVAGKYSNTSFKTASGVPVSLYYYPSDSLKAGATYRHTKVIFEYLEEEIGVDYPWADYKQVPVRDFLYAGMENVSLTIFSDAYMNDQVGSLDRPYVNVNAHELAHHWFGNLVTEINGTHHWLQEGFATYYALMAERHLFGEDHYYWKLYDTAQKLAALSGSGKGESLLDPGAGSLTFYEKGAWALHILRERVGDRAFQKAVKVLLETHAFENIETNDFLKILGEHTDADLNDFRSEWLENTSFPEEEAMASLTKNSFIRTYVDQVNDSAPPVVVYNDYVKVLKGDSYYPLKQYLLKRAASWPLALKDSLWSLALEQGDIRTRQGVALAADTISSYLKPKFETLLDDGSYITVQEALFKLWLDFPEQREGYLRKTAHLKGLEDRALRVLWLGLALFTPEYREDAPELFDELTAYTGPKYQFEVRQQALNMLFQTGGFTKTSLLHLIGGTQHPSWQFSRFCKSMLDRLVVQPESRIQLRALLPEMDEERAAQLRSLLDSTSVAPEPTHEPRP